MENTYEKLIEACVAMLDAEDAYKTAFSAHYDAYTAAERAEADTALEVARIERYEARDRVDEFRLKPSERLKALEAARKLRQETPAGEKS